jgi:hypothetical protein
MRLPTERTPPKTSIADLSVLLYGRPKIGKSTFCAGAEGALFLATEPGLNHLEVFQIPIRAWDELLEAGKALASKSGFRTVIIDTVDRAYRLCAEHVCRRLNIQHESDAEFGKGFSMVNAEFHRALNRFAQLESGLFLLSHCQDIELERDGKKTDRTVPTLPGKAREIVLGLVDVIAFADIETRRDGNGKATHKRVLRTKPNARYEAGDRTGRLPEMIDLEYAAFASAFAGPDERARMEFEADKAAEDAVQIKREAGANG